MSSPQIIYSKDSAQMEWAHHTTEYRDRNIISNTSAAMPCRYLFNVSNMVLNPRWDLLFLNGNSGYISGGRGAYLELDELAREFQKVWHTKQEEVQHLYFYTYDLCLKMPFPRAIEFVRKPTTKRQEAGPSSHHFLSSVWLLNQQGSGTKLAMNRTLHGVGFVWRNLKYGRITSHC